MAFLFFDNSSLNAQSCNPDITAPQLICPGSYTLVLDGSGRGAITLADAGVAVTDNCGTPTISLSGNLYDCSDVGVAGLQMTVTATDAGNNSSSCSIDITVVDGTAPTLVVPAAITYECALPAMQAMATATDGCGISSAGVTFTDGMQSSATVPFTFTRTFSATDVNGNTATGTQQITVTDSGAPTLSIDPVGFPLTQNIACDASATVPTMVSAMDSCAGSVMITSATISTQGTSANASNFYNYSITTTYTADDGAGNTASLSTVVNVSDIEAPTFTTGLPTSGTISTGSNAAGTCFAAYSADLSGDVTDNCAPLSALDASYVIIDESNTITNSGSGLTVSENLAVGTYEVLFTVLDPSNNTGSFSFMLTVDDGNAPTAICNSSIQLSIGSGGTATLSTVQVDAGSSDDCSPVTLALSQTTFDCSDIGTTVDVILMVSDAAGNMSQCTTAVNVVDNSNPAAFCQDISRALDANGQTVVTAQDIAAGPIAGFDVCGNPTMGMVSEDGINFFPSVTLDCTNGSSIDLTLQITDGNGNSNTCVSTVTLMDAEAPVATCTDLTRDLSITGSYSLTSADSMAIVAGSSDNCAVDRITFSRATFTCADLDQAQLDTFATDTVQILVTIFDAAGNSDMCTAVLTLNETIAPAISCIDQTLSLDANGNLSVSGEQLLAGNLYLTTPADDSLTTASFTADNAYDLSFDFSATSTDPGFDFGYILNGTVTSLATATAMGSETVNLNAGQTISFFVEAQDGVIGGQGGAVWISELSTSIGTTIPASAISFAGSGQSFYADACGPLTTLVGPVGGPYAATINFDCTNLGAANTVELQVTDQAGNTSLCSSTITVVDEAAPQVICVFQTVDLNQTGTATLQASSFDNGSSMDACDGRNITFSFVDEFGADLGPTMQVSCDSIGSRDIFIAATDQSGNVGFCQTTVQVNDNLGPQISVPASIASLDCSESLDPSNTGLASATDNCDGAVSVSFTDLTLSGTSRNCRTIRRRFSAIDSRGNISFAFQDITIVDNTAPIFESDPMAVGFIDPNPPVAECTIPARVIPAITDNCDVNVTDVVIDTTDTRIAMGMFTSTSSDAAFYNFDIMRTWTATDSCGNSSTQTQFIQVRDTEAPVFDASVSTMQQLSTDAGSCFATVSFDLTGLITDGCAPSSELTVTNDAPMGDGAFLAQGTYPVGMHSITFVASDPSGNSDMLTINFEVNDMEGPIVACLSGFNLTLSSQGVASISAVQLDNGSIDNCGIASYQLSQSSFTCADLGFNRVTLTVTDFAGNQNSCTTSIIVSESTVPVFTSTPADVTVDCSDDLNDPAIVGTAAATTACGTSAMITSTDVTIAGTFDNCRTIERTYTATSAGGLTATAVQIITVEDNSVPTYDNAPLPADRFQMFECAPAAFPVITASDDCGAQPLVSIMSDFSNQGSDPAMSNFYNYILVREFVASDGCNTASPVALTYRVVDTSVPVVNISDQTIPTDMGTCQGTVDIDLALLTSDCADASFINFTNDAGIGNGENLIQGVLAAGVYPINFTATDPSGNDTTGTFTITIEDQQGPNAICDNVTVTLVNGVATITAADINEGSTDNCSATADLTLSLDQTTFTTPGDFPVVLTVTDEAGNSSTCTSTVSVIAPLTITAGSTSGGAGEIVQLGINATNFVNVNGLSGTISLPSTGVANFVNNITFNPIFNVSDWSVFVNDDQLTFTYTGSTQVSLSANGANLFMIDVELEGMVGDMTDVIIDGSATALNAVQNINGTNVILTPATGTPGVITVIGVGTSITVSGMLSTANASNNAIALADVGYLGSSSGTFTTGASGTYSYTVPVGGTTTVEPFKDINYSNGVDIIDLADLRQHVLTNPNKQINDGFNRIAADVAPDGDINILDIIEVQQTVLDPINYEFTNNTSWRFVADGQQLVFTPDATDVPTFDESATFNNVTTNISNVNFTGVKIGDINRTAVPSSLTNGGGLQGRTTNTLEFIVQDQAMVAGETYEVELQTRNFTDVLGYQFTLTLDNDVASLDAVQPGVLAGMNANNFNHASDALLSHVWDNATDIDYQDGEIVFMITVTALENGMLSDVLEMNSDLTNALAYGQDRSQWDVDLVFESVSNTSSVLDESFSLSQNRPNPYSTTTLIDFELPNADQVIFHVIDVNGRIVLERRLDGFAGKQTIELQANELPAAGVYHYQLITSKATLAKSMLLTN